MIHRLCASCGRSGAAGLEFRVSISSVRPGGATREIVGLCHHCADPARFSSDQLADAIIAEFQRQLSPKGSTP